MSTSYVRQIKKSETSITLIEAYLPVHTGHLPTELVVTYVRTRLAFMHTYVYTCICMYVMNISAFYLKQSFACSTEDRRRRGNEVSFRRRHFNSVRSYSGFSITAKS